MRKVICSAQSCPHSPTAAKLAWLAWLARGLQRQSDNGLRRRSKSDFSVVPFMQSCEINQNVKAIINHVMQSKSLQHPLKIACFWYVCVKRSLFSEGQITAGRFHLFKSTHHTVCIMSLRGCNRLHFFVQWEKCYSITEMVLEFALVIRFFCLFVVIKSYFATLMNCLIKHILPHTDGHLKIWRLSQWSVCPPQWPCRANLNHQFKY